MHTTTAAKCLAHLVNQNKDVTEKKCQTYTNPQKKFPLCMKGLKKNMPTSDHPPPRTHHPPSPSNVKWFTPKSPPSIIVYCLLFLGIINPSYKKSITFSLEIQGVILNASRLLLNVTGKFAISCTVIGGPDDLTITWLKAGKEIGLSHRTKVETQVRRSRLSVRNVTAEDEGAYICQAKYANRGLQNREFFIAFPIKLKFETKVLGTS